MKLIRFLLFPLAIIYNLITYIRNRLFDAKILKSTCFSVPIIAVGNLNVGGTGKTPQIEYLIRLLQKDYKIAVLSRGYKRKTKGYLLLNDSHSAKDVGDEPLQFYKKFKKIKVAVDVDRVNGIQELLKADVTPEVILLDDAYQHRKVKAGYYVLLTKYDDLFSDDFLLPTGNLRESRRGANRANLIMVTKCPENLTKLDQERIINKLTIKEHQKVFFSSITYNNNLKGIKDITIESLKGKEVILVTGIANPSSLLTYLKKENIKFKHLKYPDHHEFSRSDINRINTVFNEKSTVKKIIVTTEKDYVRLQNEIPDIYYIEIENSFFDNKKSFDFEIQGFIKR